MFLVDSYALCSAVFGRGRGKSKASLSYSFLVITMGPGQQETRGSGPWAVSAESLTVYSFIK